MFDNTKPIRRGLVLALALALLLALLGCVSGCAPFSNSAATDNTGQNLQNNQAQDRANKQFPASGVLKLAANKDYAYGSGATIRYSYAFNYAKDGKKKEPSTFKSISLNLSGQVTEVPAAALQDLYTDEGDLKPEVYLCDTDPSAPLVYLLISGEDDWAQLTQVYAAVGGKLVKMGDPSQLAPSYIADDGFGVATPSRVEQGQLVVESGSPHSNALGIFYYELTYQVQNSQLVLSSPKAQITKVRLTKGGATKTLKAYQPLQLVATPGASQTALTLGKGQTAQVQAVQRQNGLTYYQLSVGTQVGWLAEPSQDCTYQSRESGFAKRAFFYYTSMAD